MKISKKKLLVALNNHKLVYIAMKLIRNTLLTVIKMIAIAKLLGSESCLAPKSIAIIFIIMF